ncbi:MAG: conjugal transfer protein TrbF [Pseudomonadota bacterium]
MSKPFKEETKGYQGKTDIETPYQHAKQLWDQRIGNAQVQARNWRFAAIINGILAIVLVGALVFAVRQIKPHLFIAQVTSSGQVVNVEPLRAAYTPSETQQQYFLAHFVTLIRSVPLDPVVARQNWSDAYHFLSERGAMILTNYWKNNSPISLLGKQTVTVEINSVNPISPNTFSVNWTETIINLAGQQTSQKKYTGVFTIAILPPTTQQQILQNPLGLYITDFHFSLQGKPGI